MEGDVIGVIESLNLHDSLLILLHHLVNTSLERSHLIAILSRGILLHLCQISACGDVANCSHYLQLCSALIDVHDARIAIKALAGVVAHETATTVNLDAVVGGLVSIFARRSFR